MSNSYNLRSKGNMPTPGNARPDEDIARIEEPENQEVSRQSSSSIPVTRQTAPPGFSHLPRYNVQIEQFNGRGDAAQWWLLFTTYITLQKIPEMEAILMLPFFMVGVAREWFSLLPATCKNTLAQVEQALYKRFKTAKHGSKLTELKQGETESCEDYIHRAMSLNSNKIVTEDFLLELTEKGFRKDLAGIIIPQRAKNMEELRDGAAIAERTLSITTKRTEPEVQATINQAVRSAVHDVEKNLLHSLTNRMEMTLSAITNAEQHRVKFRQPVPPQHADNGEKKECTFCGGKSCNNDRLKCPASNKECGYCHKLGHFKRACFLWKKHQANKSA